MYKGYVIKTFDGKVYTIFHDNHLTQWLPKGHGEAEAKEWIDMKLQALVDNPITHMTV
jgi:hypothetical protein